MHGNQALVDSSPGSSVVTRVMCVLSAANLHIAGKQATCTTCTVQVRAPCGACLGQLCYTPWAAVAEQVQTLYTTLLLAEDLNWRDTLMSTPITRPPCH